MNTVWSNIPYGSRPQYCTAAVLSQELPYWEDTRVLVNWKWALNHNLGPTDYMLGLTSHRIGLDEMRPEIATSIDWQRVANAVKVEWLVAIQWIWNPIMEPALRALISNPLIKLAPELYCYAWNRGRDCHLEAVTILNELKRIGGLRNAEPILVATDAPEWLYKKDATTGNLVKKQGSELTEALSYSSCQPNPGLKFWRDRGLVQRCWQLEGIRRFGVWGWEYTSPASQAEAANAMWQGINNPTLDLEEWTRV